MHAECCRCVFAVAAGLNNGVPAPTRPAIVTLAHCTSSPASQVFASGKDRANPASPLHTSFKLSADDGYLALLAPDGSVVSEVQFPE